VADRITRFATGVGRVVPDATSAAIVFLAIVAVAALALLVTWLVYHFAIKQATLDLNAMNVILLALGFLSYRSVGFVNRVLQAAAPSAGPVLVLYPLYAAVAGLMQHTAVGTVLANYLADKVSAATYPLITAISGRVVAMFVPSSAGQWTIQGFVAVESAKAVGVPNEPAWLALGVGDQMGNLLSPFWFLIAASVARVDFRSIFGYGLILSALWFAMGVAACTFIRSSGDGRRGPSNPGRAGQPHNPTVRRQGPRLHPTSGAFPATNVLPRLRAEALGFRPWERYLTTGSIGSSRPRQSAMRPNARRLPAS
jgi:short-chain fatty acids transporter